MKLDMELNSIGAAVSATDWVQQSRTKELERSRKLAEERRRQYEETLRAVDGEDEEETSSRQTQNLKDKKGPSLSYSSTNLAGLKVAHHQRTLLAESEEQLDGTGGEVILTLADTSVLTRDEQGKIVGMNEEEDDILENVHIAEAERRQQVQAQKKRLRQPLYSAYDDEEFETGVAPGQAKSILPQYDQNRSKKSKAQTILTADGWTDLNVPFVNTTQSSDRNPVPKVYESLQVSLKPATAFLSLSEVKARKKGSRPKARVRSVTTAEEDEEDYDLANILDNPSSASSGAMEVAEQKPLMPSTVSLPNNNKAGLVKKAAVAEHEPDEDLAAALAKARAQAVKRNQQMQAQEKPQEEKDEEDRGARQVLQLLQAARAEEVLEKEVGENEEVDTEGRRADGSLIFNSTTEFSTRLQATLNERARHRAEAAVRDMEKAVDAAQKAVEMTTTALTTSSEGAEMIVEDELTASDASDDQGEEDENEEDDQLAFLHDQPLASKGLGAALDLLRSSGDLKHKEELAGRAKDNRAIDPSAGDVGEGIKIEYRDDYGRKLTQKEAFRQLSYRFHGYGPSKKKKEKRLKSMELQTSSTSSRTGILDGVAGTMKSLVTAQEATGKAHVVVQGGVQASAQQISSLATKMMAAKAKKQGSKKVKRDILQRPNNGRIDLSQKIMPRRLGHGKLQAI
eukprot:gene9413-10398_t